MKYILLLVVVLVMGCKPRVTFENFYSISNGKWCIQDTALFDVYIPQSGSYSIDVCVRHSTDYELSNLWCFVYASDSTHKILADTLNIKLAEPDGRWCGTGYSLKTVEQPITHKVMRLEQGNYQFKVAQGMRMPCVNEVTDVGIKVVALK